VETPTFGSLLREYRLGAGLTQEALAERACVSLRGLSDLERGVRRSPYADTVNRLARALGLDDEQHAALTASRRRRSLAESSTPGSGGRSNSMEPVHSRQRTSVAAQSSASGISSANGIKSRPAHAKPSICLTNLPAQLPSLIGRDEAILTVCDRLLAARPGLLTLTGPGGCGKTRLAVAVAESLLDNFEDGVWLVDLAPIARGALVPAAILSAVGLRVSSGQSGQARLLESLPGRSLLLVLDNCEHLAESCATLADELLRASPALRILATSREPLRVAGEQLWPVAGLPFVDPDRGFQYEHVMASPAARLFVERAQAVRPEFALTTENFRAVGSICSRLGGLPLAIELAAARTELLSPAQILTRLDDAFAVLAGYRRTGPARHQTIRASIAWSYQLLDPDERLLFARLAVFAGGWTLESAEAVCGGHGLPTEKVLDALENIVSKSLVAADAHESTVRHRFHETVRQYAREQLDTDNSATYLEQQHTDYFVRLAEAAEPHLRTGEQISWLVRLDVERDNFRAALSWAAEHSRNDVGLRLACALWRYWGLRGDFSEGRDWLDLFLNRSELGAIASPQRARALAAAGSLSFAQGALASAAAYSRESLELFAELSDKSGMGLALNLLGGTAVRNGDFTLATGYFEQSAAAHREGGSLAGLASSIFNLGRLKRREGDRTLAVALIHEGLEIWRNLGDRHGIGNSLLALAEIKLESGDPERAEDLLQESLDLFRHLGDSHGTAWALGDMGRLAYLRGDYERGRVAILQSLQLNRDTGQFTGIAICLRQLASFDATAGDYGRAARLLGGAARLEKAVGHLVEADLAEQHAVTTATIKDEIGEENFSAAYESGRSESTESIVRFALDGGVDGPCRSGPRSQPCADR
jgi:non-specific serine/threonine protein kinase